MHPGVMFFPVWDKFVHPAALNGWSAIVKYTGFFRKLNEVYFPQVKFVSSKGPSIMTHSIRALGWSTICVSAIIILSELMHLSDPPAMDQFNMIFSAFPQARQGMDSLQDLFTYNRWWSIYSILYFSFVLTGAIQFIRYRKIGLRILKIACWIGLVNACVDSVISYRMMEQMNKALASVIPSLGAGIGSLNTFGMAPIVGGFFLWTLPTIGMILYLRKPRLAELMK
jgi:hypothetical protein